MGKSSINGAISTDVQKVVPQKIAHLTCRNSNNYRVYDTYIYIYYSYIIYVYYIYTYHNVYIYIHTYLIYIYSYIIIYYHIYIFIYSYIIIMVVIDDILPLVEPSLYSQISYR